MNNTRKLSLDAMLAAMCAVLGYVALEAPNFKLTFESVPILVGALMFGPVDGLAIGGIGTLIYQLLRYGVSVTTPLWIFPYALCGLLVGLTAKRLNFEYSIKQLLTIIVLNELLITLLNTGVMYIDSKIFGYYSFAYIFGTFIMRVVVCVVKAIAYALIMPGLLTRLQKAVLPRRD